MSWSPEELVKQLRYPVRLEKRAALMRDAADMIERLTQTHWVAYRDRAQNAEAAIARVRKLCELAIRDPDSGVGIEDIVNAIEGNQP